MIQGGEVSGYKAGRYQDTGLGVSGYRAGRLQDIGQGVA
jgi:hypothetical protein